MDATQGRYRGRSNFVYSVSHSIGERISQQAIAQLIGDPRYLRRPYHTQEGVDYNDSFIEREDT